MRSLVPFALLLVGCAELPEIRPCEPTGLVLPPTYLRMGNYDQMIASLQYQGCEDYAFRLCGIGDDWFTEDVIRMGIWYDDTLATCEDDILVDENFNLYPLRKRYEDQFDVEAATVTLDISGTLLDYSFAPED